MRLIKTMTKRPARSARAAIAAALSLGGLLAIIPSDTNAQALTPMRGNVAAFGEHFAVRVKPSNPYKHRIGVEMRVYDHEFRPVPTARVVPNRFFLGGGMNRDVVAYVPFEGQSTRYVRVCAESVPFRNTSSRIRTRVCGKFRALQR